MVLINKKIMNVFLRWIYILNFGLACPFMSIGGSTDVSKKKERHKITDWMQNKVAPNCYVRTFMFVDFLYMFSFSFLF